MTFEVNHLNRVFGSYNGPWQGEILHIWNAYTRLSKEHSTLVEVCLDMAQCEGDLKAVHIPHALFRRFREALGDGE